MHARSPAAGRVDEVQTCMHAAVLDILAVDARFIIEVAKESVVDVLDDRVPAGGVL